jgi:uncharacterized protein with HEPN domain
MKDFANSYEQIRWKLAAASHARLAEALKLTKNATLAEFCKKRITELEQEFPQLK